MIEKARFCKKYGHEKKGKGVRCLECAKISWKEWCKKNPEKLARHRKRSHMLFARADQGKNLVYKNYALDRDVKILADLENAERWD